MDNIDPGGGSPIAVAVQIILLVVASWYGPGLYGNHTACGQVFTTSSYGVAHKTLPCGSLVTLTHGSSVVTVPVIDRGPFVAGREFDLTAPVRNALGCSDLCTIGWVQP